MGIFPVPFSKFFQIHSNKTKLHPVCNLSQAVVSGITQTVFLFGICKNTLNGFFPCLVHPLVDRSVPGIVSHILVCLPDMTGNRLKLYTFVDNHDVERIYTKLRNKAHFVPVHIMLYTLPGIPSVYYGSEFGIEGRKERGSDDSLRPSLNFEDYKDAINANPCTQLISALGRIRRNTPILCFGDYRELVLQTTHFAYERTLDGKSVIVTVNNADNDIRLILPSSDVKEYTGALSGEKVTVSDGHIRVKVPANGGEIWIPTELHGEVAAPIKLSEIKKTPEAGSIEKNSETAVIGGEKKHEQAVANMNKPYEEMTVEELQEAILEKMRRNGPVTEYMLGTVRENIHHGSLINWVKSFN